VFESVCLLVVLALMVFLTVRRVDVSYALVSGSVCLAVLFAVPWHTFPNGLGRALGGVVVNLGESAIDLDNLQLLGLVLFIQFLGHALKHVASLRQLIGALKALLPDRRAAMAVAPAFIGLLPMPGGALFSAPMVGELTDDLTVPSEDRTLINFWFRHIWEWVWPLYPGVLFASAIIGAPLGRLMLAQSPMTLAAVAVGTILCFRRVTLPPNDNDAAPRGTWGEFLAAVWPVLLIIVLTAALGVAKHVGAPLGLPTKTALLVALLIVNPLFLVLKRVPWREVLTLLRATVTVRICVLVYGVVTFGHVLRAYDAVEALPATFSGWGVPPLALIFFVPLIVGLLTGYMPAVVGISFPVLVPLLMRGTGADAAIHYGRSTFAYAGGFFGVLLSPVHLCLVLSREYFTADVTRVYRRLFLLVGALAVVAVGVLFLWGAVPL